MDNPAPRFKINYDVEIFSLFASIVLLIYIGTVLKIFLPPETQSLSMPLFLNPAPEMQTGIVAGIATSSAQAKSSGILEMIIQIPINFFKAFFESFSF